MTARWAAVHGLSKGIALAAALLASVAWAGPPDPSCTAGCPGLLSDQIAFLYDDPNGYEIVAELDFCGGCNTLAPGVFQLVGQMHVDFGPYTVAGCDPDDAMVIFPINVVSVFVEASPPPTGEMKYVPFNPAQVFPRAAGLPLRTACVAAGNLDYSIPNIGLIGNVGAATPGFDPAILTLPENVRGVEDDGSLAATNDLPPFIFRQNLTFAVADSKNDVSLFRFWPDGLPFRLGPGQIIYTEHDVTFTTPGGTEGPTPYEPVPPHAGGVLDDDNPSTGGVINCDESDGVPCTASYVYGGGYFEAAWEPANAFFDANGLDVDLSLPGTESAIYEPVFPRGVKVTLEGPGSIPIRASAIAPGGFGGGEVRLTYDAALFNDATNDCPASTVEHVLDLSGSPHAPEIGAGGALLAGIEDLNASALFFLWSHNGAQDLGCGTLYVPPALTARGTGPGRPQEDWLASARPTERGRGVYAGVNYNRNGICTSGGVPTGEACVDNGDCVVGICETYSPRCEPFDPNSPVATWRTHVEKSNLVFDIAASVSSGREMAFFARASGVTGVFDAGQTPLDIGDPNIPTFDLEFSRFGLAFKNSLNHPDNDSIVRGQVNLPWPARTDIPFDGLTVCDCGSLASAQVPEFVQDRLLAYWDATFRPYGLDFTQTEEGESCLAAVGNECAACEPEDDDCSVSSRVCVTAETPVPHFTPDPDSVFDLNARGRAGIIEPIALTELRFEENDIALDPYVYHVTHFAFSDWDAALADEDGEGPTEEQVTSGVGPYPCQVTDADCPYGFLDADGQVVLPFFGLSDAGIKVQRKPYDGDGPHHLVDLHERGLEHIDDSFIRVRRPLAADTLDLGFKVDYFPPSMTTAGDGSDGIDLIDGKALGRGIFLGFGFNEDPAVAGDPILENQISLGALPVGAGVLIRPDEIVSDFGPAAALRLWGNTLDAGTLEQTGRDMLENILSPERLTGHWQDTYSEFVDAIDVVDIGVHPPEALADLLLSEEWIDEFALDDGLLPHPDFQVFYNVGDLVGEDPSPETIAKRVAGYLDFASPAGVVGDLASEIPELARVEADIVSLDEFGNEFFAFARSQLDVRRHVREAAGAGEQAIMELGRNALPGSMKLPGAQDIDFPDLPGVSWEFDYDVTPPEFTFKSLTGSLDLTEGGLSGLGFRELGATLKFYPGGDWFFEANADIDFNEVAAEGDILLGSTTTMAPLRSLAPDVADFLGEKDDFDGAFLRVGMRRNWVNFGCPLLVNTRVRVGGWYFSGGDTYGGSLEGRLTGDGACVVTVTGNHSMRGGMNEGVFTLQGDFWVAGGVGWDCDEGSWDRPRDVLRDGGCLACVVDTGCVLTYPHASLDCVYPRYRCR